MKTNTYKVSDHESGNYVLYHGTSLVEAKETTLNSIEDDKISDREIIELDLYCNESLIWSGKTNTENELKLLIC
jgi:hypothetical protein